MKHIFFTISLCLFTLTLRAQDAPSDSLRELKTVHIADAYFARNIEPISFQNLGETELNRLNVGQEPSFLLSQTPSMTVYSDAGSFNGYSYYRLRGIDQTRINMTLDGVPLNEPEDQGVYFSNYPDFLNSVEQLQIQRGVGSSQNGTASYGGSLQFRSPSLFRPKRIEIGANYGSFNSYRLYGEYNSGIHKNKALYVRASHVQSDGYKYRSANRSQSAFFSAGSFQEKSIWKLTGFVGRQANQLAWLGVSEDQIAIDPRTNANAEEDDVFAQGLIQLQNMTQLAANTRLHSNVYYNFLDGNYDFDFNNFLGAPSTEELFNYAFRSHFFGAFSNLSYEKDHLSVVGGIHLNRYQRQHIGSERSLGELYQNTGFRHSATAFAKMRYQLKRLLLFSDLQYRYSDFSYDGNVSMDALSWHFFNPRLGLTFLLNEQQQLYYSFGRTGREPTRNDMFLGNDDLLSDGTGAPILGNTEAEFVNDHELGWRLQKERLQLGANFYFMDFQNEIVLNGQFGPNGLALTSTVDNSYRTGLEFSLDAMATNWLQLHATASLNQSRISQQGIRFSPILTPAAILFQETRIIRSNWEAGLSIRYQSSSWLDFANENQIDGYLLVGLSGQYEWKSFRLGAQINNLLNQQYFNNGYAFDRVRYLFVQAPTNVNLSLTWTLKPHSSR
ncbi:MAG: TonB-dependent receptor [Bacteroidota bacterium]